MRNHKRLKFQATIGTIVLLCVISVLIVGMLTYVLFFHEEDIEAAMAQEDINTAEAAEYLGEDQLSVTDNDSSFFNVFGFEYKDNRLYRKHKTTEAQGKLDSVIEIPKIELRQAVFTGTESQIKHDLAHWLPVTSRTDYKLGETPYCVYMHNDSKGSLTIFRAQEELRQNDYIIVTKDKRVFLYRVLRVYPECREVCIYDIANNKDLDKDLLYIFTCGKNEWNGKNSVIEARFYQAYDKTDWDNNKDKYIAMYKITLPPVEENKKLKMDVAVSDDNKELSVSLTAPDGKQSKGCSIGLFDTDGYLIDKSSLFEYNGEPVNITVPDNTAEFVVGVYKNTTKYVSPEFVKISRGSAGDVPELGVLEENEVDSSSSFEISNIHVSVYLGVWLIITLCILFKTIVQYVKKKK